MATLSIRIPDNLKEKVAALAEQQGVSMNNFITSCLSSAVAQETTRAFLLQRLEGVDLNETTAAFERIMSETRRGRGPSMREVDAAIRRAVKP
jgi:predicted transcriptional regulator